MHDPLLTERQATHGSFDLNAMISQALKREMHKVVPCWSDLSDVHKECLHMIALKISRVLSGHADFKDHWNDIAGYAKLGAEHCDD